VSHELRTPLASIKGYASTLLAEDVVWDPDAQREFLHVISQETDRLSDLVTDLLDLSRIEAGNLKVERSAVHLKELISDAASQARFLAHENLTIQLEDHLPTLPLDRRRIEVVIRNLLENAAKYGEPKATITIKAERQDGCVVISIRDHGPGIPDQYVDRVFEPFFRIDDGLTLAAPGAGLGLSICQGFVEAHGGQIWLSPVQNGTCVNFSLPLEERS
jgi:signal transduction histidine kinase